MLSATMSGLGQASTLTNSPSPQPVESIRDVLQQSREMIQNDGKMLSETCARLGIELPSGTGAAVPTRDGPMSVTELAYDIRMWAVAVSECLTTVLNRL